MSACRGTRSLPSNRSFEVQKITARGRLFSVKRKQIREKSESNDSCPPPAPRSSIHTSPNPSKKSGSNSVKKKESIDTPSSRDKLLEEYQSDDSLLKVQVHSTRSQFVFYVPVSLLIEREYSMRETAFQYGIGDDRWISSLLYREWKRVAVASDDLSSEIPEDQSNYIQSRKHHNGDVTIALNPEHDCAHSNHSQSFKWTQWLTECIRSFYSTGMIQIPNNCKGSDILLALEYFGIIYSPDQLSYDSFGVYLRVKLWSEYFTHRAVLGEWIMTALLKAPSKHSHFFVTSPTALTKEHTVFVGSTRGQIFDGELALDPEKYSDLPSCSVVHDFFHNQDHSQVCRGSSKEKPLDELMRQDFSTYLQTTLPGTSISFIIRNDLTITDKPAMVQRAVLHIDLLSGVPQLESEKGSTELSSSFPPPKPERNDKPSLLESQSRSISRSCASESSGRILKRVVSTDKIRIPLHTNRTKDEKQSKSLDFNTSSVLPIRSFGDGDQVDVMSGLTNPWREDEMTPIIEITKENLDESNFTPQKDNALDVKDTENAPISSQLTQEDLKQKSSTTVANTNTKTTLESKVASKEKPNNGAHQILKRGLNHSQTFNAANATCCDGAKNASISGSSLSSPSKCNVIDFTLDSLTATFTSILDTIPDPKNKPQRVLHPTVELQPHVKIDRNIAPGHRNTSKGNAQNDETKSEETAWPCDVIPFNQYIYNDPVPDKEDEYLCLARKASRAKPRTMMARKVPQKAIVTTIAPKVSEKVTITNASRLEHTSKQQNTYNSRPESLTLTSGSAVSPKFVKAETYIPVARAVSVNDISSPHKTQSTSQDKRQKMRAPLKTASYPADFLESVDYLNGVAPRKMCVPAFFSRKAKN